MKTIKNTIGPGLTIAYFAALFSAGTASAQILLVDSVTVDSVWNSDSSFYDGNGILQQRTSRDCKIGFILRGGGPACIAIAISTDRGKSWGALADSVARLADSLTALDEGTFKAVSTGQKSALIARIFGGDRPGIMFKVTARQYAPVISGNPNLTLLGITSPLVPGADISVSLHIIIDTENLCFSPLNKVYWDALGDGVIDDSTSGVNNLSWTWNTQVPLGTIGQKRGVIVRAMDKNGLSSLPETLSVQFGPDSSDLGLLMDYYTNSLVQNDSAADSLVKAASNLAALQQAYVNMKFGMFINFNMSTFERCCCAACNSVSGEWADAASATVVPNLFRPSQLNCGQWADAAKSAGMKYMVLTAKHHDGFCLWPSRWNSHNVKNSSWGSGKRDVVKEFVDSARTRGIKVGLYYSMWDHTNGSDLRFIKAQLAELLTNYGPITCIWFDGWGWMVGYNTVPYDTIRNLVKTLQPNCLIVENNHYYNLTNSEIVEFEMPIDGTPPAGNIQPAEGCQPIRTDYCWFWHPNNECNIMPTQNIINELTTVNSHNASYLLDLTPDTLGLIPQCQVDAMANVGVLRGITP